MDHLAIVVGMMAAQVTLHTGCQPADALFAVESEVAKRKRDEITTTTTQEIVLEAVKRVGDL